VPGTIVYEHDWKVCGELVEFVHIGWAIKWTHKISVFLVSVGQQGSPRAFDSAKLVKEGFWDLWKEYYTLSFD